MKNTVTRRLPVPYTADELTAFGEKLAADTMRLGGLEEEKAESAKGFKTLIDGVKMDMDRSAKAISEKRHFAEVECSVTFNSPSPGRKTFTRLDDGEDAGHEAMDAEDFQSEIDFGNSLAMTIQFNDGEEIPLPGGLGPAIQKLKRSRS